MEGDAAVELMSTVALEAAQRALPDAPEAGFAEGVHLAVACGAYLSASEFLFPEQIEPWAELCRALPAVGWRPAVRWIDTEVDVVFVPGVATREQVDAAEGVREIHPADTTESTDRGRFVCYLSYLDPDDEGERLADVAGVLAWIAATDGPSGE